MTHEDIARICHEALGALLSLPKPNRGEMSEYDHLYWEQMDLEPRQVMIRRVREALRNPEAARPAIDQTEAANALFTSIVEALRPFAYKAKVA